MPFEEPVTAQTSPGLAMLFSECPRRIENSPVSWLSRRFNARSISIRQTKFRNKPSVLSTAVVCLMLRKDTGARNDPWYIGHDRCYIAVKPWLSRGALSAEIRRYGGALATAFVSAGSPALMHHAKPLLKLTV